MRTLSIACVLLASVRVAAADPQPIAIEYTAPIGCPDEISVRAGVIARLGKDPFRTDAPRRALIDVTRTGAGFVAAIELHEPGQPVSRKAVGPAVKCDDAIDALELALAVIVDPAITGAPAPTPPVTIPFRTDAPPPPAPQPYPQASRPAYEPPGWGRARAPVAPPSPPRYELAIAFGTLSGAAPQGMATFGLRAGYVISEELHAGMYARFGRDDGDLDASRTYNASIAELHAEICTKKWLALGCAVIGVGSKSVTIDRDDGMFVITKVADYSTPYFLAGASLSFDLPLGRGILRPTVNALVPMPPVQLESEGLRRAELPIVDVGFDLALGYRW